MRLLRHGKAFNKKRVPIKRDLTRRTNKKGEWHAIPLLPEKLPLLPALFRCLAVGSGNHGDVGAPAGAGPELDMTIDQRIDRVVLAKAHARARLPLGAALAHNDVSGPGRLSAKELNPKAAPG